jgi:hypothetical protein
MLRLSTRRGRSAGLLVVLSQFILSVSCTTSETALTSPTTARCRVGLSNSAESVPAAGGAGTLSISAERDCAWAASASAGWLVLTSASNGQGNGEVSYRVATNGDPAVRRATIEVNSATAAITQEAAECRFTVAPPAIDVDAAGATHAIQVQGHAACEWTAATGANWIDIESGSSGKGNGTIAIEVAQNDGSARTASIQAAGTTVTVRQSERSAAPGPPAPPSPGPPPPPSCTYTIQPTGQTLASAGGAGTIDVTASASTCGWTAQSNVGWLTITAGHAGSGTGRVTFNVAANNGASRTGTVSVAGRTFTLSQAGASCNYSINPSSAALSAAGADTTVSVVAGGSCTWTAAGNGSWITIAAGANGTGAGTVTLRVAANSGAARTGVATIAAQTFTVTQAAAPCTISIGPASFDLPAGGGERTTNVSAGPGCAWTARSNDGWITVTNGSSGTGNGAVTINVGENTGPARSGTLTIGGQTLVVTQQPAACTIDLQPANQSFTSDAGSGTVTVTATGGSCNWTALSNDTGWLTVTSGHSGSGGGVVGYSVAANTGASRTGTLTIGGQVFTVTQQAAPCSYSLSPGSQTMTAAGGTGTLTVTTGGSCSWSAASSDSTWLTITAGASGTGGGQVAFSVAANAGAERTGTITVAGQTFTLSQSAP